MSTSSAHQTDAPALPRHTAELARRSRLLVAGCAIAASALLPAGLQAGPTLNDAQARQILMANAWCSFSYNKISGASHTSRVTFHSDGTLHMTEGGESYSSGYGGTVAGQSSRGRVMRWQVRQLHLLVDANDGAGFQDVGLDAYRNSSGALILRAAGTEYAGCR